jgi:hypothetical protein
MQGANPPTEGLTPQITPHIEQKSHTSLPSPPTPDLTSNHNPPCPYITPPDHTHRNYFRFASSYDPLNGA